MKLQKKIGKQPVVQDMKMLNLTKSEVAA